MTNSEPNAQINKRPSYVTDEQLEFLDDLRESGAINMFGAKPYIVGAFDVTLGEARGILSYWMNSFGDPNR